MLGLLRVKKKIKEKSRSSRSQMFFQKDVLKNFSIFMGKHLYWILINKVESLKVCSFIIILRNSAEYCKILKNTYYIKPMVIASKNLGSLSFTRETLNQNFQFMRSKENYLEGP